MVAQSQKKASSGAAYKETSSVMTYAMVASWFVDFDKVLSVQKVWRCGFWKNSRRS
jgi:hypothetical protein